MTKLNDGYLGHAEQFRSEHATVACNHASRCVDDNRYDKTKLLNAIRDLIDLLWRMLPRVLLVQHDLGYGSILNLNADRPEIA